MLHFSRTVSIATTAVFLITSGGSAQRPIELGTDASMGLLFNSGTLFFIDAPLSQVRVGFRTSEKMTLEPRGSLTILSGEGSTLTAFAGGLHVLYDFQSANGSSGSRAYVTGGGNILFVDSGFGPSNSDVQLGGGIGIRIPIRDRLSWRLEGRLDHQFDASVTSLAGLFGLSFFTR